MQLGVEGVVEVHGRANLELLCRTHVCARLGRIHISTRWVGSASSGTGTSGVAISGRSAQLVIASLKWASSVHDGCSRMARFEHGLSQQSKSPGKEVCTVPAWSPRSGVGAGNRNPSRRHTNFRGPSRGQRNEAHAGDQSVVVKPKPTRAGE